MAIVHAISDVLDIDINRVKVIDSYKIRHWDSTRKNVNQNQLLYRNQIVISPSEQY